jgi:hypothetical protein
MPYHLCSRLGIRVSTYLKEAFLLPILLCAPTAAVFLFLQRRWEAHTYRQLIPQLLAGGLVYAIGLAWAYRTGRALHVKDLGARAEELTLVSSVVVPAIENYDDV